MTKMGGNIEQMAQLKRKFDEQPRTVEQLSQTVSPRVDEGSTWWIGPAADPFRNAWRSQFAPNPRRLQEAPNEAGAHAADRRRAIDGS